VTVRPQVDGRILSIDFKEGQDVRKGDVLARIDPATFQAQLDQALAKRRLTEVQLDNARRDLARLTRLTTSAVAEKTVDTQRAQVAQLEAQLKADDASIDNARAVLGYTTIVAPIDGRTGMRMSDAGNLVRASDAGIVVITEVKPISVTFTVPQQQLQTVSQAFAKGPLSAEALDTGLKTVIDTGQLVVIDNLVDSQTGTVRLKADFPNAEMKLWPGQFVNVRLRVDTLKEVVTVPTPAVQRGPAGPFVYLLQGDDKVQLRTVTLGLATDKVAVIAKGVAAGDRVVTSGFGRLSDGASVSATPADAERPSEPSVKERDPAGTAAVPAETGSTGEARAEGRPKGEGKRGRRKDANAQQPASTP
jgi:multidrug efflux system membrane fusion protein